MTVDAASVVRGLWIASGDGMEAMVGRGRARAVINAASNEVPRPTAGAHRYGVSYCVLGPLDDSTDVLLRDLFPWLQQGVEALRLARTNPARPTKPRSGSPQNKKSKQRRSNSVIVNCFAGVNRSAAVIVAYLSTRKRNPMAVGKAIAVVEVANSKRPDNCPCLTNQTFRRGLALFPDWFWRVTGERPGTQRGPRTPNVPLIAPNAPDQSRSQLHCQTGGMYDSDPNSRGAICDRQLPSPPSNKEHTHEHQIVEEEEEEEVEPRVDANRNFSGNQRSRKRCLQDSSDED